MSENMEEYEDDQIEGSTGYYRFGMRLKVPPLLKEWWSLLGDSGRHQVKIFYLGRLPSLMNVEPRRELVEAIIPFWDDDRAVFRFGKSDPGWCELTPTLEEVAAYALLPIKESDAPILVDDIRGRRFLEILGLDRDRTFETTAHDCGITLDYLYQRFATEKSFNNHQTQFFVDFSMWRQKRIMAFVIAFLGIMIFPMSKNRIHIRLGFVVNALAEGIEGQRVTLVPLILAEVYRALHKVKQGARFFEGCNLLLQLWMIEHLRVCTDAPQKFIFEPINRIECPKPEDCIEIVRRRVFNWPPDVGAWTHLLSSLTENEIQWNYTWLLTKKPLIRSYSHPFFVLGGLRGSYPYPPPRVMRQFGRTQTVPAYGEMRQFIQEFDDKKMPHRGLIINMWKQKDTLKPEPLAADRYRAGYDFTYPSWLKRDIAGWVRPSANAPGKISDEGADYRGRYLELRSNALASEEKNRKTERRLVELEIELAQLKADQATESRKRAKT